MKNALSLTRLAFGVRYHPQYKIRDRIGTVIDDILRKTDTPFGPGLFPLSKSTSHAHVLLDADGKNKLTITQSDALLEIDAKECDIGKAVSHAYDFEKYILDPLKKKAKIGQVVRYGTLYDFGVYDIPFAINPLENMALGSFKPRDFVLQFSERIACEESLFRKDVSDFQNLIYSIQQDEKKVFNMFLDYQMYFEPALDADDWRENRYSFASYVENGAKIVRSKMQALDAFLSKMSRAA